MDAGVSTSLVQGLQTHSSIIYVGARDPNSGPWAYMTSAFLIDPSPQICISEILARAKTVGKRCE